MNNPDYFQNFEDQVGKTVVDLILKYVRQYKMKEEDAEELARHLENKLPLDDRDVTGKLCRNRTRNNYNFEKAVKCIFSDWFKNYVVIDKETTISSIVEALESSRMNNLAADIKQNCQGNEATDRENPIQSSSERGIMHRISRSSMSQPTKNRQQEPANQENLSNIPMKEIQITNKMARPSADYYVEVEEYDGEAISHRLLRAPHKLKYHPSGQIEVSFMINPQVCMHESVINPVNIRQAFENISDTFSDNSCGDTVDSARKKPGQGVSVNNMESKTTDVNEDKDTDVTNVLIDKKGEQESFISRLKKKLQRLSRQGNWKVALAIALVVVLIFGSLLVTGTLAQKEDFPDNQVQDEPTATEPEKEETKKKEKKEKKENTTKPANKHANSLTCSTGCERLYSNITIPNGKISCEKDLLDVKCSSRFEPKLSIPIECKNTSDIASALQCVKKSCGKHGCEDSLLILAGGENNGKLVNTVHVFPEDSSPSCLPNLPRQIKWGSMGILDGKLLVCGGQNKAEQPSQECWVLDNQNREHISWKHHIDLSSPRSQAASTVSADGSMLYILSGYSTVETNRSSPSMQSISLDGPRKERILMVPEVEKTLYCSRMASAVTLKTGQVLVTGGSGMERDVFLLNGTDLNEGIRRKSLLVGRLGHASTVRMLRTEEVVLVAGGWSDERKPLNSVELFRVGQNNWEFLQPLPQPRVDFTLQFWTPRSWQLVATIPKVKKI